MEAAWPNSNACRDNGEGIVSIMTTNEQVQMRTCPLCEGMCGIEVRVQDGQVLSVRPDRDNVLSRGHMCPKGRSEEHKSELQSLMRTSYAVFCLQKKKTQNKQKL